MKNQTIKTTFIFTAMAICLMAVANISAQTDDTKRFEVSGEYSYTYARQVFSANRVPNGWDAGIAYKFNKWFSLYGEAGWDRFGEAGLDRFGNPYSRTTTRVSFLAGVRIHFVNKTRFTPFINAGVGDVRFRSALIDNGSTPKQTNLNNLLFAAGEGVDIALNKKRTIQWRIGAEYRRMEVGNSVNAVCASPCTAPIDLTGNAFRFHTGIVFHF